MALIRKSKFKDMTVPDLEAELTKARSEMTAERSARSSGSKSKSPARIRNLRRLVARLTTKLAQKGVKK